MENTIFSGMTTSEILKNIRENGGFDNFNNWTRKEIKEWVLAEYHPSKYVAEQVSWKLAK